MSSPLAEREAGWDGNNSSLYLGEVRFWDIFGTPGTPGHEKVSHRFDQCLCGSEGRWDTWDTFFGNIIYIETHMVECLDVFFSHVLFSEKGVPSVPPSVSTSVYAGQTVGHLFMSGCPRCPKYPDELNNSTLLLGKVGVPQVSHSGLRHSREGGGCFSFVEILPSCVGLFVYRGFQR